MIKQSRLTDKRNQKRCNTLVIFDQSTFLIEPNLYFFLIYLHFQNLPVERIWPEVNARVNYPIKKCLVEMDNQMIIDMDDETHKYCVSAVTCLVADFGLQRVVRTWNEHAIPGNINFFFIFYKIKCGKNI